MDETFHYPPDLFELLVNTISRLCTSKKSVLLFFQGAGVDAGILADLRQKVDQDKQSIHKYEISRTILTRLNTKGDATLRERREILKRVIEFEEFSTCWPNDQLVAKGLVAEVRKLVNVKDSFTRMKQEFEHERQMRRAEHQARTSDKQRWQTELEVVRKDLYSLFSIQDSESQRRGKLLEDVLNRLFKLYDISIREAFTVVESGGGIAEQIDGAVEIDGKIYLVEMKWRKDPLGKQDVSPHLVNLFNRGEAGGILISKSGFTRPALMTCKEALAQRMSVCCELEEIVNLLESNSNLRDFLKEKFRVAVMDKNPLHKPLI